MNGTAERSWWTLSAKARCMLNSSPLDERLWPLAINYAAILYNRTPIARTGRTPYELMHGHKPNVAMLQRFGACMHAIKNNAVNKMSQRTTIGHLVGLCKETGGYLFWEPQNEKLLQVARSAAVFPDDKEAPSTSSQDARDDDPQQGDPSPTTTTHGARSRSLKGTLDSATTDGAPPQ